MSFVVGTAVSTGNGDDGATPVPVTKLDVEGLPLVKPPPLVEATTPYAHGAAAALAAGSEPQTEIYGPEGLPLLKPPYGRITAIDLNNAEVVWQIADGETPDAVKNHPPL